MKKAAAQSQSTKEEKKILRPKPEETKKREERKAVALKKNKEKTLERLDQSQSILFKIPSPILFDVFLLAISAGKELVKIILLCKRIKDSVYSDPRPWLSLLIYSFPKTLGKDLLDLKSKLKDGYLDRSKDWKTMYIKEYSIYIEKLYKKKIENLNNVCKPITAHKFFQEFKSAKVAFSLIKGRDSSQIPKKDIKVFDQSFIIKTDFEKPSNSLGTLVVKIFGKTVRFEARNKKTLQECKIVLIGNECGLEISLSGDTYTHYWIISFSELYRQITNYSLKVIYDDISSRLGLIGYNLQFDMHSLTENLASHTERSLDLEEEGSSAFGLIENLKIRIPKQKLVIDWKTFVFSDKVFNAGFIDFTVFDGQGRLFLWTSQAFSIDLKEVDGNEGDGFSAVVSLPECKLTCYMRDKGASYLMSAISIEISLEFIQKYISSRRRR